MSSFLTIPKAIDFFLEYIQPNQGHCRKIILEAFSRFKSILGTNAISSGSDWIGQMVSHPLPVNAPLEIKDILMDNYKVEIPIFEWNGNRYIRSSFQVYNEKKDIDSLMSALDSIF